MKILFTSSGLVTQELIDKTIELCNKDATEISVAVINEASKVELGDKRWIVRHLNDLDLNFGGEIEIVDLQALNIQGITERLKDKDLIYVLGGDADYLMSIYEKSGLSEKLPELLKTKVYIGCSAGAMVLGKRTSTQTYIELFAERSHTIVEEYMNLIDYVIFPHMDDEKFPHVIKEKIDKHFDVKNEKFFAIQREQAVVVNENKIEFVGGTPYGF